MMASLKEYYRRLAEENIKLREEVKEAKAEAGDAEKKAEAFDYLTGRGVENE